MFILSASNRLRRAVIQEEAKPQYDGIRGTAAGTMEAAKAVKRDHPEAFDLNDPADALVWAMAGD